jgi:hypothetical protein
MKGSKKKYMHLDGDPDVRRAYRTTPMSKEHHMKFHEQLLTMKRALSDLATIAEKAEEADEAEWSREVISSFYPLLIFVRAMYRLLFALMDPDAHCDSDDDVILLPALVIESAEEFITWISPSEKGEALYEDYLREHLRAFLSALRECRQTMKASGLSKWADEVMIVRTNVLRAAIQAKATFEMHRDAALGLACRL